MGKTWEKQMRPVKVYRDPVMDGLVERAGDLHAQILQHSNHPDHSADNYPKVVAEIKKLNRDLGIVSGKIKERNAFLDRARARQIAKFHRKHKRFRMMQRRRTRFKGRR